MAQTWVLVVDDDATVRGLVIEALTAEGYKAVGSGDGQEALDLLRSLVPHLLVLDLRMPHLSGGEFLAILRESPALRGIPVVILSGFLNDARHLGDGLNIVARLKKPVALPALLHTIEQACRQAASRPPAPGP